MTRKHRSRLLVTLGGLLVVALILTGVLILDPFGGIVADPFPRDTTGLPTATLPTLIELHDGDTVDLRASMVRKRLGSATVKMYAYNGSIPGPTLKVPRGATVTVTVANDLDVPTTVHWHGLRLDNRFDGVPGETQAPISVGGRFTYRLHFPDEGIYWYHPHLREDYAQELGLYGTIIVAPADTTYWPPANRELSLTLDDVLLEGNQLAPFSRSRPNRTAMGRYGNIMLVNGETDYQVEASLGEVVRLYLTNTANARPFNFRLPGARLKLVGGDNGRVEREAFVEEVLLAPSERAVVDVLFDRPGRLALEHRTPDQTYRLGTVTVGERPIAPVFADAFATLRHNPVLERERAGLIRDLGRPADKMLRLIGKMAGMSHQGGADQHDGIEWEDTMSGMNRRATPRNMHWQLIDPATGAVNHAIDWSFRVGERVKLRIVNEPASDHPMQHPIHLHGQRFLVLSRDGILTDNLVWKDSVLVRTGETVDLLVEMTNPGLWMLHCHIAEHAEGGMMFSFRVGETAPAPPAHTAHAATDHP